VPVNYYSSPACRLSTLSLLCASFLSLTGCATTVVSTPFPMQSDQPLAGMAYALPKAQLRLTVIRKLGTEEDVTKAKENLEETEKKSKEIAAELKKYETEEAELKKLVAVAKNEGKKRFEENLEMLSAQVIVFKNKKKTMVDAKKTAADALETAKQQTNKISEQIKVEPLDPVPDRASTFVANLNHLPTRDDSLQITVENGMLSSTGKAVADDKTADILVSIASIIGGKKTDPIVKLNFLSYNRELLPTKNDSPNAEVKKDCKLGNISRIFDPTNQAETKHALSDVFKALSPSFSIKIGSVEGGIKTEPETLEKTSVFSVHQLSHPIEGLAYRPLRDLAVTVTPRPNPNCAIVGDQNSETLVIAVPDTSRIAYLPMQSGALNNNTTSFAFSQGSPKEFTTGRASEIAALLKIPVNIAKALISVPTDLIKLRVDYSSEDTKLLKSQLDLLKASQELKDKLKELNDAKAE
jgi:hypothetical protein